MYESNSGASFREGKGTKFDFGWRSVPDPAGGAYNAPQADCLAGFQGHTSKKREWEVLDKRPKVIAL